MATLVTDPMLEERLRAERERSGADRFDEVWEGTCFMPPLADNQHQDLAFQLAVAIHGALGNPDALIFVAVNVSDREEGWVENYRVPDVGVFLPGGQAKNCGTHWCGGPDFAVEIVSPGDRALEKLAFYAAVGVRELLLIERDPWALQLFGLKHGKLTEAGRSEGPQCALVRSEVVPVTFRLAASGVRPAIELAQQDGAQQWLLRPVGSGR
jgi:Uma2 family endonuclease